MTRDDLRQWGGKRGCSGREDGQRDDKGRGVHFERGDENVKGFGLKEVLKKEVNKVKIRRRMLKEES